MPKRSVDGISRFVPVTWTMSPALPSIALNPVIFGIGLNTAVVGFARGVLTVSGPITASSGTCTFTDVAVAGTASGTAA